MNREMRRRREKEERRANSKKNFIPMGYAEISIDQLQHDENLKECDQELLDFMMKAHTWKIKSSKAKNIVKYALSYLDSLCSLRFDITPSDDKKVVRDTMHVVSDTVNLFIGLRLEENMYVTLREIMDKAGKEGNGAIPLSVAYHEELLPMFGDVETMPTRDDVDDMYADFVVEHANELGSALFDTTCAEIMDDEENVYEALLFVGKKIKQLLPEADI